MDRFEDERLLRGTSRYVEDLDSAQCLHAVFVRSPHAHARIVSFDSRAARESEGVRGIFSGRHFLAEGVRPLLCVRPIEGSDGAPFHAPTRHVLALEESRFVGDPVAIVVATSIDAAAGRGGAGRGGVRTSARGAGSPGKRRRRGSAADRRPGSDGFRILAGCPCGPDRTRQQPDVGRADRKPVPRSDATTRSAIRTVSTRRARACTSCAPSSRRVWESTRIGFAWSRRKSAAASE